jgi:ribose transport system substrate-binding protein
MVTRKSVLIVLFLLLAASLVFAGGQAEAGGEEMSAEEGQATASETGLDQGDYVIALSNSYYGNTWRKQMVDTFNAAAEMAKGQGLISDYVVVNGDNSVNTQVSQMNSLILQGVDAICINAASPTALNSVIEQACEAGIKVIAFDSIATAPCAWKMDFDFVGHGETVAGYVKERLDGDGNVIVVRGVSGSAPDQQMYEGQVNVLEETPDLDVVATINGEASATKTQNELSNILPSLPEVDAVLTQGGGDAYGAAQAFEASDRDMPIIVGDGTAEHIQWWLNRREENPSFETFGIASTPGIGGAAFWVALAILNDVEVPMKMKADFVHITNENVGQFADLQPGTIASPTFTYEYVMENIIVPQR